MAWAAARYIRKACNALHNRVECAQFDVFSCAMFIRWINSDDTDADFVVREAEVTFWGTCASCRARVAGALTACRPVVKADRTSRRTRTKLNPESDMQGYQ